MLICLGTRAQVSLLLQDRETWCSEDLANIFLEGRAGPSGLVGAHGCACGSRRALSPGHTLIVLTSGRWDRFPSTAILGQHQTTVCTWSPGIPGL